MLGSAGEETSRKTLMFQPWPSLLTTAGLGIRRVAHDGAEQAQGQDPRKFTLGFHITFPVDESWIEFTNLLLRHMRIFLDGYTYSSHGGEGVTLRHA